MGDRIAGRAPEGPWEYALSAADELVMWHLDTAEARDDRADDVAARHTQVVVLLAAALYDRGVAAGLAGADLARVELGLVSGALEHHAASIIEAAPATAGLGGEQREQLLAGYGTPAFDDVRTAGLRVLAGHTRDGGVLLADRAAALAAESRARRLRRLEDWIGEEY